MAEEEVVANLVTKLSLDDRDVNKSMAQLNREMKAAKSELDATSSSVAGLGKAEEQLKVKTEGLTKQLDIQQQKVLLLQKKYNDLSASKGKDARETQALESQLNKAVTTYNKLHNEMSKTQQDLDRQTSAFNKLSNTVKNAEAKLNTFGRSATEVGQSMTVLAAPLIGVGIAAGKAAIDYETAFAGVRKTVDATEEELEGFRQGIRNMAKLK